MTDPFGIFQILIGAYLIYCAITKKGMIYQNDNIKEGQEELYLKRMRTCSWVLGPAMVLQGCLGLYYESVAINTAIKVLTLVLFGVEVATVVLLFVVSIRMTDRSKPKKEEKSASSAAFDFDIDDDAPGHFAPPAMDASQALPEENEECTKPEAKHELEESDCSHEDPQ